MGTKSCNVTGQGTMTGAFAGMPATHKHAAWSEIHISRFKDGKIVEHWGSVDQLGMLQQAQACPHAGAPTVLAVYWLNQAIKRSARAIHALSVPYERHKRSNCRSRTPFQGDHSMTSEQHKLPEHHV